MTENRLLQSLPLDLKEQMMSDLVIVTLRVRDTVAQRGAPLEYVYFPTTCLISVVVNFENGATIEAELVGNDGYNGVSLLLGRQASNSDMFVQIAGDAWRMEVADFRRYLGDPRLRDALGAYSASAFTIVGQLAGCVAFHPIEQRLARWLLMVRDRVEREDLPLTHEFLGVMLGVYRPTVTVAVHTLERAGLIEHRRGHVRIIDDSRLEQAACECYGVIRDLSEDPSER